jgi:NTE family protein
VVEVKFDRLGDEKERTYFKQLPTSFKLEAEQVDKLREVAHRIMNESPEFQRLISDLR